jgi:hypothetical protein
MAASEADPTSVVFYDYGTPLVHLDDALKLIFPVPAGLESLEECISTCHNLLHELWRQPELAWSRYRWKAREEPLLESLPEADEVEPLKILPNGILVEESRRAAVREVFPSEDGWRLKKCLPAWRVRYDGKFRPSSLGRSNPVRRLTLPRIRSFMCAIADFRPATYSLHLTASADRTIASLPVLLELHATYYGKWAFRNLAAYGELMCDAVKDWPATLRYWGSVSMTFTAWLNRERRSRAARRHLVNRKSKGYCTALAPVKRRRFDTWAVSGRSYDEVKESRLRHAGIR